MNLTNEDGKDLIKIAKNSISSYFTKKEINIDKDIEDKYSEKRGVFVTLTIEGNLRGCIGYTQALFPLWQAISQAAQAAAFEDTRFNPLTSEEFQNIKIEVSVLTKPELMTGDYLTQIEIGKHGLIVEKNNNVGLLLPQVFTEYNVDAEHALEMTCQKAGLPTHSWKEKDCKVYKFSAQIFTEE